MLIAGTNSPRIPATAAHFGNSFLFDETCGDWPTRHLTFAAGQGGPMNPSHKQPHKKRGRNLSLELLEDRQLLSAGGGSTFAIMSGNVATAKQVSSVQFKINPSDFTPARNGKILLGIDVAADPSTSVQPEIVSVKNAHGQVVGG